jgi:hypothetical protein
MQNQATRRAHWALTASPNGIITASSSEQSFDVPLADIEQVVRHLAKSSAARISAWYGAPKPYRFDDRKMRPFAKTLRQDFFPHNRFLTMARSYAVPGMLLLGAVSLAGGGKVSLDPDNRTVALQPEQLAAAISFFEAWNAQSAGSAPGGGHTPPAPVTDLSGEPASILEALLMYRNVVLEGVAGTGKSFVIGELSSAFDRTFTLVLHPTTGYEDLVEGLRPVGGSFEAYDGVLVTACKEAAAHPEKRHLVVLDEVNRANTARVMGDLMLVLEPSKRVPCDVAAEILSSMDAEAIRSTYPFAAQLQAVREPAAGGEPYRAFLAVPDNLYVLATMNTTDRSVGQLDLALRRRFVPYRMDPLPAGHLIAALGEGSALADHVLTWSRLNEAIRDDVGPDAMLGHSYFFEFTEAVQRATAGQYPSDRIWTDMLLPQLGEVLVAFGATEHLPALKARARGAQQTSPVDWLTVHGDGLEVGYVIEPGAAAPQPTGDDPVAIPSV